MNIRHSLLSFAIVSASALGMGSAAQARGVAWSIGIASPGVQLGVSNGPVIYGQPVYQAPLVVQPSSYYYTEPQVVYTQPQVVYQAPPVIYAPQPYYYGRTIYAPPVYYRHGWAPNHWRRDHDHHR